MNALPDEPDYDAMEIELAAGGWTRRKEIFSGVHLWRSPEGIDFIGRQAWLAMRGRPAQPPSALARDIEHRRTQ